MSSSSIKIAVASDLHAYSDKVSSPSHLGISMPENLTLQHPVSALIELIRSTDLRADVLLSPGDLGDRADAKGIAYAWKALSTIAVELRCKLYTATAGNHDLDSRYKENDHDPTHILRGLEPSFPLQDETQDDTYWSRTYAIRDQGLMRLVLLNSSAYHGSTAIEKNHGRVDSRALERLRSDLSKRAVLPVNVLLCHHHPHQHSELNLGEDDVMKNGQQLLDLLGSGEYGRWLVVDGHKHHPRIAYAAGGASSPIVFAAGSFSAILTGPLQTAARNQFYVIEIDPEACVKYGMVGKATSWDWSSGVGWIEAASAGSGLPAEFGFGVRKEPLVLADEIAQVMSNSGAAMPWKDILSSIPELQFLLPQDLREVIRLLRSHHALATALDGSKLIVIGRLI